MRENILTRAIEKKTITTQAVQQFKIFSDMTALASKRREFVRLIDSFKAKGGQATIVQQSKLKVLANGKFHILDDIGKAQGPLQQMSGTL